jgi:DNA-directed RNA polymerase subunit RPC12/RpoP
MARSVSVGSCNYFIKKSSEETKMATYKCSKCGMAVNATCAKCDAPLVHDTIKMEDGTEIHVSKCPNGHGKIKSPMCCGEDMSCPIG